MYSSTHSDDFLIQISYFFLTKTEKRFSGANIWIISFESVKRQIIKPIKLPKNTKNLGSPLVLKRVKEKIIKENKHHIKISWKNTVSFALLKSCLSNRNTSYITQQQMPTAILNAKLSHWWKLFISHILLKNSAEKTAAWVIFIVGINQRINIAV